MIFKFQDNKITTSMCDILMGVQFDYFSEIIIAYQKTNWKTPQGQTAATEAKQSTARLTK